MEDIGIDNTMLFAKKFSAAPIVIEGIPYANRFDAVCVYNGYWAMLPTGIEVGGPSYWEAIVIGGWADVSIGC